MKVILLQELKGQGSEGDVVEVNRGYANNYLFPKKLAVEATPGELKQLEQRRGNIAKREESRKAFAEQLHEKLDGLTVQIDARVGEEGQLFGSVTTQMIADALLDQHGIEIDRKLIDLKAPVKTAGLHESTVTLHRDIKSTIKMVVGDAAAIEAAEAAAREAEEVLAAAQAAEAAAAEAAEAEAEGEGEDVEGEAGEAEAEAGETDAGGAGEDSQPDDGSEADEDSAATDSADAEETSEEEGEDAQ